MDDLFPPGVDIKTVTIQFSGGWYAEFVINAVCSVVAGVAAWKSKNRRLHFLSIGTAFISLRSIVMFLMMYIQAFNDFIQSNVWPGFAASFATIGWVLILVYCVLELRDSFAGKPRHCAKPTPSESTT